MSIPSGLLQARHPDAHKGDFGHALIVAGSSGLSGAAVLCSLGAIRAGAGLVTLAAPASLQDVMAGKLTEVMTRPLPETKSRSVSVQAVSEVLRLLEDRNVLALGPGLSQESQTKEFTRQLLPRVTKPCVVDADAINAIAEDMQVLKRMGLPPILTPHPGEMGRLIRLGPADVQRDRERIAKDFAQRHRAIVVLKGFRTLVANVDGECYVNDTGNPGMATAGVGDVLSGVIAGLLAQDLAPFDAARLGVYVHGLAGDLAAQGRGAVGLIASDLLDTIPRAIQQYQSSPA